MSPNNTQCKKPEELLNKVDSIAFSSLHSKIKAHFESNNFYRAINQNGEDIIKVLNQEGHFEFIGPSIEFILGYKEEELLEKSIFPLIHPKDCKKATNLFHSLNNDWEYKKLLFRFYHKNRHVVYLESYCYFKLDIEETTYYVLICKNVSDRKQKEKQLRESKLKEEKTSTFFKRLIEFSPDIISLWNLKDNTPVYYNKKQPFGYDWEAEGAQLYSEEIIHKEDFEYVKKFRSNLNTIPFFMAPSLEFRIRRKDGQWEWIKNTIIVMERNEEGFPELILSSNVIITDLKNIQKELENSKLKMQAILENTTARIWSIDKEFRITAANSIFIKEYNKFCSEGNPIGKSVFADNCLKEKSKWEPLYKKALSGLAFTDLIEYQENEKTIYHETSFNPIVENEEVQGVSCFNRDITSLKQSEADLKQLNYELDSFVYRASHDMMAPLKSILGLVNILKMELSNAEKEKYLTLVEKSVKKLDSFIHDLTSFSRNSRLPIVPSKIDFEELINASLENLGYMENADKIFVLTDINERGEFYSDQSRLQIIFQNFISNSIKYQRLNIKKSELKINISCDSEYAIIEIKDNGKGIKHEYLPRIFDMFFRASEESYGSGLGLYITKQAIEKLDGKILKVESTYGEGTSITISIPGTGKD